MTNNNNNKNTLQDLNELAHSAETALLSMTTATEGASSTRDTLIAQLETEASYVCFSNNIEINDSDNGATTRRQRRRYLQDSTADADGNNTTIMTNTTIMDSNNDTNTMINSTNDEMMDTLMNTTTNETMNTSNITDTTANNNNNITIVLDENSNLAQLLQVLSELRNSSSEEVDEMYNLTQETIYFTEDIDSNENLQTEDWQGWVLLVFYILIPASLVIGTVYVWRRGRTNCVCAILMDWILLPLFVIQVIVAYLFSAILIITATANSDFCVGTDDAVQSPDSSVLSIFEAAGVSIDSFAYRALDFYVGQCQAGAENNPFSILSEYIDELELADTGIADLTTVLLEDAIIAGGNDNISEVCRDQIDTITVLSGQLDESISSMVGGASDLLSLLRCDTVVPLYTNTVYDATCTSTLRGTVWAFAAYTAVAFAGMMMIMLRSSWQPSNSKIDDDDDVYNSGNDDYYFDSGSGAIGYKSGQQNGEDEVDFDGMAVHKDKAGSSRYVEEYEGGPAGANGDSGAVGDANWLSLDNNDGGQQQADAPTLKASAY